jgi:hypothetical protein
MEGFMEGFVQIHPRVEHVRVCPKCRGRLVATDWAIPGQWTLGLYHCDACGFDAWADLPFNLGVLSPRFTDTRTKAGDPWPEGRDWYANVTRFAWEARGRRPVHIRREVRRAVRRICLVNALGNCWGDAVMTVAKLNALTRAEDVGIVVLTTANLAPHLPKDVAEAWFVDGSHAETSFWNEALTEAVKAEVSRFDACHVPTIFQLPSVTQQEAAALTGIVSFDRTRWDAALEQAPTITFLWRDDRCWAPELYRTARVVERVARQYPLGRVTRLFTRAKVHLDVRRQVRRVNVLARELRRSLPRVDFAVAGQGTHGRFSSWITDLRRRQSNADANRLWCERAARSHLLIGVLGSQMMLPSALAGGVIDLVPSDRLRGALTDWFVTSDDVREAVFLYRMLPLGTDAISVAETAISMLVNYSCTHSAFHHRYYAPLDQQTLDDLVSVQDERARILAATVSSHGSHLIGP